MILVATEQRVRGVTPTQLLRAALTQADLIIAPGCFDALSARAAVHAGHEVLFMSGFAVSAARLGMPDTGLISFAEMLDSLRNLCSAAEGIPVIGDADTGFGNALNVRRTVIEYARAGAACAMIEDQVSPKRCGHTRGKQVVSRMEARMRIRAAVDARTEAGVDILIMARTDARAVHGFQEALERCKEFEAEGADLIFLEAPEGEDEMIQLCSALDRPCVANVVPGGRTPVLTRVQLQKIGYKLALYPVLSLSSAIHAMQTALTALRKDDTSAAAPAISFTELQDFAGFPDYWGREALYKATD
jgi:2-methylisocitrate lyase-like PEP mutase family enzyme